MNGEHPTNERQKLTVEGLNPETSKTWKGVIFLVSIGKAEAGGRRPWGRRLDKHYPLISKEGK